LNSTHLGNLHCHHCLEEIAMPDPHDNAKMSGDIHPPDVESDLPLEEESPDAAGVSGKARDRGKATERGAASRPGRGIRKAGALKDKDDETSDDSGNTRDSGESTDKGRR
jgi:hypothetical protein